MVPLRLVRAERGSSPNFWWDGPHRGLSGALARETTAIVNNLDIIGHCALDLPLPSADHPGRMILLMQTIMHTPTIDDTTTCHVRAAGKRRPTLPVHTTEARWQHAVTCSRQSRALPLRQTRHDHSNITLTHHTEQTTSIHDLHTDPCASNGTVRLGARTAAYGASSEPRAQHGSSRHALIALRGFIGRRPRRKLSAASCVEEE